MSLLPNETFGSILEDELRAADLPSNPTEVIGRAYRFGCEHGSHHNILVGTIVGIEVSDEGGLELYVSHPSFWSAPVGYIYRTPSGWALRLDDKRTTTTGQRFAGEFELL